MARGIGAVVRGIAVTTADDGGGVPAGWRVMIGSHPVPDARSVAAGEAVLALCASTWPDDEVIVAISGGASSLCEVPSVPLDELVAAVRATMAGGAPIAEINRVRSRLSRIKGGKLARATPGRILTLVASDVVGDDVAVIGSGPTIAQRPGDRVQLVASLAGFADHVVLALGRACRVDPPLEGEVSEVAARIVADVPPPGTVHVAYGEPTLRVPRDAGEGGRAQQLALLLAERFRGTARCALVAGSDGIDGPAPVARPAPAGAIVDGTTWDAIRAAGLDPAAALVRCDAGSALHAVDALLVVGATGVNHADVVLYGGA